MAKHYATKVNDTIEKIAIVDKFMQASDRLKQIDELYLSTTEQKKLFTIVDKIHALYEEVNRRMEVDIKGIETKDEQKQKLKEVNKKLKTLSPEKLDKLLSTL